MSARRFFIATVTCLSLFSGTPAVAAQTVPSAATRPASAQAAGVFEALDTNKDKALSLQEFQTGYAGVQHAIAREVRLREQFRTIDADHNGAIEAVEYTNLVLVKRAGKAAPALSAFDADKDQKLGFAEYVAAVRQLSALHPATAMKSPDSTAVPRASD
jgi:hypothetical protein